MMFLSQAIYRNYGRQHRAVHRPRRKLTNIARYPPEVLSLFTDEMGLLSDSVVADIGSGTGISAKMFLENGNSVYAVEPNQAMRLGAEAVLSGFDKFHSIDGTAEDTSLPDGIADIIIAAQAFHWFRPAETRLEFKRILKKGGFTALIWNERQSATTDLLREYEELILKYGRDYREVRHERITDGLIRDFFQKDFKTAVFSNVQSLDLDGLRGRTLSSSYMPNTSDPLFQPMLDDLSGLFAKHEEKGKIEVLYDTKVYYCAL